MPLTCVVIVVILVCLTRKSLKADEFVNPPNGSVIANFEGAKNASTLTCNVLNSNGVQTTTNWFLQNFRSQSGLQAIASGEFTDLFFIGGDVRPDDPTRTYRNELTFLNFISDLDHVTMFCGTGVDRQAFFLLRVVYQPEQPYNLSVVSIETTSLHLSWNIPQNSSTSSYTIKRRNLNRIDEVSVTNTSTNATFFNVTGLLPGTTYELTVVAVSQVGDIVATSEPSVPIVSTTQPTVPALVCNDPEFSNGTISVTWSYIHTGGQPLDSVSVSYTFEEGSTLRNLIFIAINDTQTTSVNLTGIVSAGVRYTFNVTARNNIGTSYVLCAPIFVDIGIPATPSFGELTPGPDPGEVTIQIKTIASGVSSLSQRFQFNIIPVRDGVEETLQEFVRNDYQSGEFETITVRDLVPGENYTFNATAINFYGTSDAAISRLISTSTGKSTQFRMKLIAVIVGGSVGAVLIVIAIIIIIVTAVVLKSRRGKKDNLKKEEPEVIYDEPTSLRPQYETNEVGGQLQCSINLNQCLAYNELRGGFENTQDLEESSEYCNVKELEESSEYCNVVEYFK